MQNDFKKCDRVSEQHDPDDAGDRSQNIPPDPGRVIAESTPPPPAPSEEEKFKKKLKKHLNLANTILLGLTFIAVVTYTCETRRTNDLTQQALQISQGADITIGRKDGVIAEFIVPQDQKSPGALVFYFQNNGHLPAQFNWGTLASLPIFRANPTRVLPPIPSEHSFSTMKRLRNKDGSIGEGWNIELGGDSMYEAEYGAIARDRIEGILSGQDMFLIDDAFESCDEMGIYACKHFRVLYQGPPWNRFQLLDVKFCPPYWSALPEPRPDAEYLSPCISSKQRQKEQRELFHMPQ